MVILLSSALSKQLVIPPVSTPAGAKKVQPKARLLTILATLKILEEKERRKKTEIELKEQRKWEREGNKRKKEEEQKRKVEERARKTEERAKEKAQKAADRARKTEETTRTGAIGGAEPGESGRDSGAPFFPPSGGPKD